LKTIFCFSESGRAIIIRCTPPLTKSMMPMLDSLTRHAVPAATFADFSQA
jgi:hypothetical protein